MPPHKFNGVGLEALLERLHDAAAFVDRSGRILLTNHEQHAGLPPSVGMTELGETSQIFRPDGRRYDLTEWPVLRSARTGEVIVDEEFFRLAPDGRRTSFSCNCGPFYDDRGAIAGAVVVARDITEQSRSQQQLASLAPLLEHTDDAIVACDAQRLITAWNRGAERMFGWTAEEVIGQSPEFVKLDGGNEQRTELRRQLSELGRWRGEVTMERKDGSSVSTEATAVAIRDAHGELTSYLGIHRDITERKRAEEQLRFQASLLENVHDAVLATDPEFVLTAWHRGAERMFGWTAEEALGRRVYELIPTSFSDEELASELRALSETGRWRGTATWYGKHGRPVIAEGITVALRPEGEAVAGYACIMRDVTEQRHAQWALDMRAGRQALLAELTLRTLASGDLHAVLDDAVVLVARALNLELATICEKLPGDEGIAWRAAHGWSADALAHAPISAADAGSLAGYVLLAGEPVVSEDVRTDRRFGTSQLFAEKHPVSAVAVVIPGDRRPFGVLVAAARARRSFTPEDVDFTRAVANVVGVAVERSRVAERMEEVRANLRARLARDIHDDALRDLADALALAATARSTAVAEDESARWDGLIGALERVGQHLRGTIYDLRLTDDEHRDFAALLSDLVDVQSGKAIDCRVELSGRCAIPAGSLGHRGTEVVRIVREAITNARVHSGATTIRVDTGASTHELLVIEVSDDGEWPARVPPASTRRGSGIVGMFERADELGAKLGIEGRPDGGTSVTLELPLGEDKADSP